MRESRCNDYDTVAVYYINTMKLKMKGREKNLSKSNTNAIAAHRHPDLTGWDGLSPDATVLSVKGRV
jgi:hypothetical protein